MCPCRTCSPHAHPPPKSVSHNQGWPPPFTTSDSFRLSFSLDLYWMALGRPLQLYYNSGHWWGAIPFHPEIFNLPWACSHHAVSGTCTSLAVSHHFHRLQLLSLSSPTLTLCSQKCWARQPWHLHLESPGRSSWALCRWAGSCPPLHTPHALICIGAHSHILTLPLCSTLELTSLCLACKTSPGASGWSSIYPSAFFPSRHIFFHKYNF